MKWLRYQAIFLVLLFLFPLAVNGQTDQQRRPVDRSRGWTGDRSAASGAASSVGTRTTPPTSATVTSGRAGSWNSPRATSSTGNDSYSQGQALSSAVRSYGKWQGYRYDPTDLYYARLFYSQLVYQYGLRPNYDYFWLYAQGIPALNANVVGLALRDSLGASTELLSLSNQVEQLLTSYESSELSQDVFQKQASEKLSEIRDLTKTIRNDFYLDYLDQRQDQKVGSFSEVASIPELRQLVAELRTTAQQMQNGLLSYTSSEDSMTRVVSVKELSQPSFKSITKRIDKISKTIEKSARQF